MEHKQTIQHKALQASIIADLYLADIKLSLQPMKFFAFIMAFLVLALSIMPCADKGNPEIQGKIKTLFTKCNHPQDDQQQDNCSPFCHCTCCSCFSINHFIVALSIIPPFENNLAPSFISSEVIEISLPIWQPPQLV